MRPEMERKTVRQKKEHTHTQNQKTKEKRQTKLGNAHHYALLTQKRLTTAGRNDRTAADEWPPGHVSFIFFLSCRQKDSLILITQTIRWHH